MGILRRLSLGAAMLATLAVVAGCEKGPVQKAGEKVDRALGQEGVIGKGPAERAGKDVDKTVDKLKN
jgi:hypothetical protein